MKWRCALLSELATTRPGSVGDEARRRAKLVPTIFLEFEKLATQMTKFATDCSTAATMFAVGALTMRQTTSLVARTAARTPPV